MVSTPSPTIRSQSMMEYFDFNMQLPDSWSDTESEKTLVHTPVGTPLEKPGRDEQETIVSLSSTFHPCFTLDGLSPDLVLASADQTLFYVHHIRVLSASHNGFRHLLAPPFVLDTPLPTVPVPESADVLNIILHTVYNMTALAFCPTFETISSALGAFTRYGIEPKQHAKIGRPLYDLVLACAPAHPIETYALAGAHDLADVAVATSAHLLSFPLPTLSDSLAQRMGAAYLKKLFFLHFGRTDALKRVLLKPPTAHSETADCSLAQQKYLTRVWALAAAHVIWDAGPNFSTYLLQAALSPLVREVKCPKCQLALRDRIASAVIEWASVKRTI